MFDACFTLCPPSFAISLMGKRKLVDLLELSSWCSLYLEDNKVSIFKL